MNDELCFWGRDKHQGFLQADTIILSVRNQACRKYLN